ncbi:hypothetical protein O181_004266 [Austropuccinia psidii MF-1]|uniref:GTP-binding protein n=1 Tax=Austropuccinia psidii MF-1 TaxID=1389203 RepID=A0A9Q3BF86_9BASI|nr:hypothetical protein [Austropuccinia psidii MF-1]
MWPSLSTAQSNSSRTFPLDHLHLPHRQSDSSSSSIMDHSISSLQTHATQNTHSSIAQSFRSDRPKLLFMGPRSAGKSSIRQVVFHKLQPDQTLHLETTRKLTQDDIQSFIDFEIWDFPGPLDSDSLAISFAHIGAIVFVIDAQSSYLSTIPQLASTLILAYHTNPDLHFEIFMHKIDAVTPDYRSEIIEQIKDRLTDELSDRELSIYGAPMIAVELGQRITYKLTTVYDYSIYDALSRVIMKIIPQQAALEHLMNILAQQSGVENCILFDTWSKLYIATDSSPIEKPLLEMCSEFMDIFTDLSELYGVPQQTSPITRPSLVTNGNGVARPPAAVRLPTEGFQKHRSPSRGRSPSTRNQSIGLRSTSSALLESNSRGSSAVSSRMVTSQVKVDTSLNGSRGASMLGQPSANLIEQPGRVVSYYEVNRYLTLVCITHEEIMRTQGTLIEYNVSRVRDSIEKILHITNRRASRER